MHIRLEKYNHTKGQKRYYALSLTRTLFGEWCLTREWGAIGGAGGQQRRAYLTDQAEAEAQMLRLKSDKLRLGYAVIPEQLGFL